MYFITLFLFSSFPPFPLPFSESPSNSSPFFNWDNKSPRGKWNGQNIYPWPKIRFSPFRFSFKWRVRVCLFCGDNSWLATPSPGRSASLRCAGQPTGEGSWRWRGGQPEAPLKNFQLIDYKKYLYLNLWASFFGFFCRYDRCTKQQQILKEQSRLNNWLANILIPIF